MATRLMALAMSDVLKNKVAAAVRAARTRRGLSQAELAEKLDLSLLAVSNIERGESIPSLETFAALVDLLKLDVAALLSVASRKKPPSRDRARVDAEIAALLDTLNDRDAALLLDIGQAVARQGRK